MLIPALIAAFLSFLAFRYHWLAWQAERYSTLASWYVIKTRAGAEVADQLSELWPVSQMMAHAWVWRFRAFVVYQDLYETVEEMAARELARNDLTYAQFLTESMEARREVSREPEAAEPEMEEPADPSRN